MGFKTASTRRSTATSAVSSQAVVINSGNAAPSGTSSYTIAGAVSANTTITIGVTTPGQSSANSAVTAASGPIITTLQYLDANNAVITGANAVSTSGGNILVNGSNFVTNSSVYINNTLATNTFISSSQIRAICPAASAGNVSLMIFSPTNVGTLQANIVKYSGVPSWTTAAVSFQNGAAANVALVASSDSTLTYTLQAGSTLPTGISLVSTGYLSGTATGYSTNTTSSVVLIATDQEGQSTQQTVNWTVTVADPQFNYTTLLLNGETSVTPFIADASANSLALTIAGDTKPTLFNPYSDGYYSNYFDGAADYLSTPNNALFSPGTGDFTLEAWIYPTTAAGSLNMIFVHTNGLSFYRNASGKLELAQDNVGALITSTNNIAVNAWSHVVVARSGTALKMFINGAQEASVTNSTNITGNGVVNIGYIAASSLYSFAGFISNLRLLKGTALYTSTFTPSTAPLTAVANTSLLTCQSNRLIDNSVNNHVITKGNDTTVSPAIPFAASSSYATYGSAYFDGTGDYLSTPDNAAFTLGTNDFTFECWVYPTSITSGNNNILAQWTAGGLAFIFRYVAAGRVQFSSGASNITGTTTAVVVSQWNHIAITRTSGTVRLFVNGVLDATTGTVSSCPDSASQVTIGAYSDGTSEYVTGYISNLRLINGTSLYSSTFTPPTSPLTAVANTQLLTCQTNGGATNQGIYDNSNFNNIITRAGNATQGTFSPYSATGWSNYSTGASGAYISVPSASWTTLAGTFTVEFWMNWTTAPAAGSLMGVQANSGWNLYNDGTTISPNLYGSSNIFTSTFTVASIVLGRWYHVAITRNASNLMTMWINGVSSGSATVATTYTQGAWAIFSPANVNATQGYMSNYRVTNTCLYTTAFTPSTTPLTAVSGTQLLTCQSNRFIDTSTNAATLTAASTVSVQAFSPFAPSAAYTPATHGGSAYFDGTGDRLTVPSSVALEMGTGDFTMECWAYPVSFGNAFLLYIHFAGGVAARFGFNLTASGVGVDSTSGLALTFTGTTAITVGQWYHVAVTRSGSTFKTWINGVQCSTATSSGTYSPTGAIATIGDYPDDFATGYGYISDMRIIKGTSLYNSTFTPPTAPLTTTTQTSLLCNFANGGIVDAHGSNVLESVGNTQLSTSVKKFGSASIAFDGTGDYCYASTNQLYAFGSGDFTIEAWIYRTDTGVQRAIVDTRGAAAVGVLFYITTNNVLNAFDSTSTYISSTGTVPANQWVHVAITRNGTNTRLFINGTIDGSINNDNRVYANGAGGLLVGRQFGSTSNDFLGYMDDVRITKGYARYTANFTAPTSGFLGQ